jgi:hypothetical protein
MTKAPTTQTDVQARLAGRSPSVVGNLDGVAPELRSAANAHRIAATGGFVSQKRAPRLARVAVGNRPRAPWK